ncbi:hypothetical protein ACQP2P_10980 [Dactylosporangium sp. CA-139114]|uniref:hypothetical protein n=1 Tax=Dactylosporangium sp. CA-139114 TaxID=3239931 RepID=UPI003D96443F
MTCLVCDQPVSSRPEAGAVSASYRTTTSASPCQPSARTAAPPTAGTAGPPRSAPVAASRQDTLQRRSASWAGSQSPAQPVMVSTVVHNRSNRWLVVANERNGHGWTWFLGPRRNSNAWPIYVVDVDSFTSPDSWFFYMGWHRPWHWANIHNHVWIY